MLGRLWRALYPSRCVACGRFHSDYLCELCRAQLSPILPPTCLRCGAPLRALGDCRACLNREYLFDCAVCGGPYVGSVRRAVVNLKFRRWQRAAEPLARLLWEAFQYPAHAPLKQADAIVPVPIHPYRRAMRGFNQTELIGRRLSQISTVPMQAHWLRRRFYRRPQVGLSGAARLQNVQDVFECVHPDAVRGRVVWLLDDVFTTGSTLNACAQVLKAAGARFVVAVAVARDLREDSGAL